MYIGTDNIILPNQTLSSSKTGTYFKINTQDVRSKIFRKSKISIVKKDRSLRLKRKTLILQFRVKS